MNRDEYFMKEAIRLSIEAVRHGNEPFGSVLVKDDKIVCTNENQIFSLSDPTWQTGSWISLHIHSIPVVSPALCAAGRWYGRGWGHWSMQPVI